MDPKSGIHFWVRCAHRAEKRTRFSALNDAGSTIRSAALPRSSRIAIAAREQRAIGIEALPQARRRPTGRSAVRSRARGGVTRTPRWSSTGVDRRRGDHARSNRLPALHHRAVHDGGAGSRSWARRPELRPGAIHHPLRRRHVHRPRRGAHGRPGGRPVQGGPRRPGTAEAASARRDRDDFRQSIPLCNPGGPPSRARAALQHLCRLRRRSLHRARRPGPGGTRRAGATRCPCRCVVPVDRDRQAAGGADEDPEHVLPFAGAEDGRPVAARGGLRSARAPVVSRRLRARCRCHHRSLSVQGCRPDRVHGPGAVLAGPARHRRGRHPAGRHGGIPPHAETWPIGYRLPLRRRWAGDRPSADVGVPAGAVRGRHRRAAAARPVRHGGHRATIGLLEARRRRAAGLRCGGRPDLRRGVPVDRHRRIGNACVSP